MQILIILKLRYGLVSNRLSQIAVLSCYWRIHQHHKTVFLPPCYLHPLRNAFPPSLLTCAAAEVCLEKMSDSLFPSGHTLGEAEPGLVILVPSAVLGGTWVSSSSLCLILLKCMHLNNLFLYKLAFERSVKDKSALPGQRRGGNTWVSTAQMWKIKQI